MKSFLIPRSEVKICSTRVLYVDGSKTKQKKVKPCKNWVCENGGTPPKYQCVFLFLEGSSWFSKPSDPFFPMIFHGFPWFSMVSLWFFHGFPWFSIVFHDIPMVFHDFPIAFPLNCQVPTPPLFLAPPDHRHRANPALSGPERVAPKGNQATWQWLKYPMTSMGISGS